MRLLTSSCSTFSIASLSLPGFWGEPMTGGVSLAIDVKYFQPCPIGRKLAVVVRIDRLGRTLGNSTTDVSSLNTSLALILRFTTGRPECITLRACMFMLGRPERKRMARQSYKMQPLFARYQIQGPSWRSTMPCSES
jgi:hypothetical protein